MASEQKKRKKSGGGSTFLLILILLVGLGLISYPSFADYWNNFHQSKAIASYVEAVADIPEEDYSKMWEAARAYNKSLLTKGGSRWTLSEEEMKEYESILDVTGTGIMGYIEIPSISVNLPIYHGTDEEVLQVAIGHIPGSSLPIGGKGSHAVVSGHRGLPSAKLFTNLDKLSGDQIELIIGHTKIIDVILCYLFCRFSKTAFKQCIPRFCLSVDNPAERIREHGEQLF